LRLPLLLPLLLWLPLPLFVLRRHPRAKRRIPVFAVAVAVAFLSVIPSEAAQR
jgi:hypothetical protein